MKTRAPLTSLSLTAVAALTLLVGCGDDDSADDSATNGETTAGASAVTTAAISDENAHTTTGATADEPAATTTAAETTVVDPTAGPNSTAIDDTSDVSVSSDFCTNVTAIDDLSKQFGEAFLDDSGVRLGPLIAALPALVEALRDTAPTQFEADVELAVSSIEELYELTRDVDFSNPDAVAEAIEQLGESDPVADAAGERISAHCGIDSDDDSDDDRSSLDPPEPPECDVLDPTVVAEAAGIDVDVSDDDGGGDFSLPGFWTKSCSYGNGQMTISTLSFFEVDEVRDLALSTIEENGGTVHEIDLGTLPESSLVAEVNGFLTVSVYEAETPFSVGFPVDDVAPAKAVAAAEALLAAQS